jgi:hypothetical protein
MSTTRTAWDPDQDAPKMEPANEPQSVKADTEYLVLVQDPDSPHWSELGTYRGRNQQEAIEKTVQGVRSGDQGGTFVAVPARSWKPVKVTPKVETTFTFEDA